MLDLKSESAITFMSASVDLDLVPILIATYLPVEICVYYQVVPVNIDGSLLILGMVDPNDLAALDYVGKMLAFSELQIHVHPLSFEEQQELIAHYFNNPPSPEQIAAYKQLNAAKDEVNALESDPTVDDTVEVDVEDVTLEESVIPDDSVESVQKLINSILRRALDEQADRIFVELNDDGTCRVRYRQQGILRDLFRELSDKIRVQILLSLKKMLGMEGSQDSQSAAVEKTYRGQRLVLQLRIINHRDKEAAVLNILQGDALEKYQQQQNQRRVEDTLAAIERAQRELELLHISLTDTVEKVQRYSGTPQPEWGNISPTLEALMHKAQQIQELQKAWMDIQK